MDILNSDILEMSMYDIGDGDTNIFDILDLDVISSVRNPAHL